MLKKQKLNVAQEIEKLDRIQKKIDARAALLEKVAAVKDFERVEFSDQVREYYMIESCTNLDEKSYMQSFISICNHSKELHIDFENPICNIIKREDILRGILRRFHSLELKYTGISGTALLSGRKSPGEYMFPPITGDIMKKCL